MSTQNISVLGSVKAAWTFVSSNIEQLLLAALPYTAFTVGIAILVQVNSEDVLGATGAVIGLMFSIGAVVSGLAFYAAVLRLSVNKSNDGWLGLKFGAEERRILFVTLLIFGLAILTASLIAMFIGPLYLSVADAAMQSAGLDPEALEVDAVQALNYLKPADWAVMIGAALIGLALMIWLLARLLIAFPATIAEDKIRVLSVWGLSTGQTARLAIALALALGPLLVVEVAVYETLAAVFDTRFLYVAFNVGPEQVVDPRSSTFQEMVRLVSLFAFINVPIVFGLYADHYRALNSPGTGH